jgi:dolichyl-phosphate beta-glucosyltransferase
MHAEGWIFDVEMLMLAESAPAGQVTPGISKKGISVAEVAIGWKEIEGSKLNVVWASLGMAWGLAILRAGWMLGVYKRR